MEMTQKGMDCRGSYLNSVQTTVITLVLFVLAICPQRRRQRLSRIIHDAELAYEFAEAEPTKARENMSCAS